MRRAVECRALRGSSRPRSCVVAGGVLAPGLRGASRRRRAIVAERRGRVRRAAARVRASSRLAAGEERDRGVGARARSCASRCSRCMRSCSSRPSGFRRAPALISLAIFFFVSTLVEPLLAASMRGPRRLALLLCCALAFAAPGAAVRSARSAAARLRRPDGSEARRARGGRRPSTSSRRTSRTRTTSRSRTGAPPFAKEVCIGRHEGGTAAALGRRSRSAGSTSTSRRPSTS